MLFKYLIFEIWLELVKLKGVRNPNIDLKITPKTKKCTFSTTEIRVLVFPNGYN